MTDSTGSRIVQLYLPRDLPLSASVSVSGLDLSKDKRELLVSYENDQLTLDFADSQKFANPHDFKKTRNPSHTKSLIEAIERVFGFTPTIIER